MLDGVALFGQFYPEGALTDADFPPERLDLLTATTSFSLHLGPGFGGEPPSSLTWTILLECSSPSTDVSVVAPFGPMTEPKPDTFFPAGKATLSGAEKAGLSEFDEAASRAYVAERGFIGEAAGESKLGLFAEDATRSLESSQRAGWVGYGSRYTDPRKLVEYRFGTGKWIKGLPPTESGASTDFSLAEVRTIQTQSRVLGWTYRSGEARVFLGYFRQPELESSQFARVIQTLEHEVFVHQVPMRLGYGGGLYFEEHRLVDEILGGLI